MTILEIVRQGLYYARTCKSLWLFGFLVGIASGGSNGGGRGGGNGTGASIGIGGVSISGPLDISVTGIAPIAIAIILALAVTLVLRLVGEGALIEGVVRARQGGTMTTHEGFRAGWAHCGVLVRIALLYLAATIGSVALLAVPCVIALKALGPLGGILVGIPALFIAVPWLVTLYLVQAFAWRIAVLENRHAIDAIGKARLFLHGRLVHGLKIIAAAFVGTLGFLLALALGFFEFLLAPVPARMLCPRLFTFRGGHQRFSRLPASSIFSPASRLIFPYSSWNSPSASSSAPSISISGSSVQSPIFFLASAAACFALPSSSSLFGMPVVLH